MPLDRNNPAYQIARGEILTTVKDIIENGSIGTAGQRAVENIANIIINNNYLFPKFARQLAGKENTRKLFYMQRNAWREVGTYEDDRDFTGLIRPQALSEILQAGKRLSAEFGWDDFDLENTEMGAEKLIGLFENALMEELNIEVERRVVNEINEVVQNGKKLVSDTLNDKDLSIYGVAKPDIISFSLTEGTWTSTDSIDEIKTLRDQLILYMNRKRQMNNPFIFMPDIKNWMLVISTNLQAALNTIKAIDIVKTMDGYEGFLNNSPVGTFNGVPVMISPELGMNGNPLELLFIPRNGGFGNLCWLFMKPISKMYTRSGFVGKSTTAHFFNTSTSVFDIMITYWGTKAGIWGVGLNTSKWAKSIVGYFKNADISKGTVDAIVNIDSTTPKDLVVNIIDVNSTLRIAGGDYLIADNGTDVTFAVPADNTKEGRNIVIEIIDPSDTLGQDSGYMIYRSTTYLLINKKGVYGTTATTVNDTNESGVDTVIAPIKTSKKENKEIRKEVAKAMEAKVEEAINAEQELKAKAAKATKAK